VSTGSLMILLELAKLRDCVYSTGVLRKGCMMLLLREGK
jgi:hypothetical protein